MWFPGPAGKLSIASETFAWTGEVFFLAFACPV
jgi:hypothetical protein